MSLRVQVQFGRTETANQRRNAVSGYAVEIDINQIELPMFHIYVTGFTVPLVPQAIIQ